MTFFGVAGGGDQPGLLLAARIPQPEATAILKKALEQPDLFVFHKGTPVKLDVSGIPEPGERTKVEESLKNKLKDLGCPIDPAGKIELVAKVEGPKRREIRYMHSGTYHVQEYLTFLKIVYEGQTLWETQQTNIPHVLMVKNGENVEGVLREKSARPEYAFYTNAVLPEFLQKPSNKTAHGGEQMLGTSTLGQQGLRSRANPQGVHSQRKREHL